MNLINIMLMIAIVKHGVAALRDQDLAELLNDIELSDDATLVKKIDQIMMERKRRRAEDESLSSSGFRDQDKNYYVNNKEAGISQTQVDSSIQLPKDKRRSTNFDWKPNFKDSDSSNYGLKNSVDSNKEAEEKSAAPKAKDSLKVKRQDKDAAQASLANSRKERQHHDEELTYRGDDDARLERSDDSVEPLKEKSKEDRNRRYIDEGDYYDHSDHRGRRSNLGLRSDNERGRWSEDQAEPLNENNRKDGSETLKDERRRRSKTQAESFNENSREASNFVNGRERVPVREDSDAKSYRRSMDADDELRADDFRSVHERSNYDQEGNRYDDDVRSIGRRSRPISSEKRRRSADTSGTIDEGYRRAVGSRLRRKPDVAEPLRKASDYDNDYDNEFEFSRAGSDRSRRRTARRDDSFQKSAENFDDFSEKERQPSGIIKRAPVAAGNSTKVWGPWSSWTPCSKSCGDGQKVQWKRCQKGGCLPGDRLMKVLPCNEGKCDEDTAAVPGDEQSDNSSRQTTLANGDVPCTEISKIDSYESYEDIEV